MSEIERPDLSSAEPGQLHDWLIGRGLVVRSCTRRLNGPMVVDTDASPGELDAALAGFAPDPAWQPPPPEAVRQAAAFLRARADAGDNLARACLALFRYLNNRLD